MMMRIVISLFALSIAMPAWSQDLSPGELDEISALQSELNEIRSEIARTEEKSASLAGGLVKALVESRLEILHLTRDLIQQRIQAVESGAKITIEVSGAMPNEALALQLQQDIDSQLAELKSSREEAARHSGGIVGAMKQATVATKEQTIAMLQYSFLAAKYGLPMITTAAAHVSLKEGVSSSESTAASFADKEVSKEVGLEIISAELLDKRYSERDYQDYMWFDLKFVAKGLDKPARAIKGVLQLQDLFGEPKLKINWTIDEPVLPGGTVLEKGTGFEFNQFTDSHQWVRAIDIQNMTASFVVTSILYQDGSRRDL